MKGVLTHFSYWKFLRYRNWRCWVEKWPHRRLKDSTKSLKSPQLWTKRRSHINSSVLRGMRGGGTFAFDTLRTFGCTLKSERSAHLGGCLSGGKLTVSFYFLRLYLIFLVASWNVLILSEPGKVITSTQNQSELQPSWKRRISPSDWIKTKSYFIMFSFLFCVKSLTVVSVTMGTNPSNIKHWSTSPPAGLDSSCCSLNLLFTHTSYLHSHVFE